MSSARPGPPGTLGGTTTAALDVATTENDPDLERFWQEDPRSAKQLRRAKRRERRSRRSPRHRFILRALALAVVLLMFQAGWSYVHALTAPGTDPLSVRSVEWVRDHGGAGGAVGVGVLTTLVCLLTASAPGFADFGRPCSGRPPTGGGWLVYHQCSIRFTMPPPPWSRTHSTLRADHGSVPGAVSAWTYDQPAWNTSRNAATASARTTKR